MKGLARSLNIFKDSEREIKQQLNQINRELHFLRRHKKSCSKANLYALKKKKDDLSSTLTSLRNYRKKLFR